MRILVHWCLTFAVLVSTLITTADLTRSGKRDAAQVLAIFGRDGNYRVPPPVESGSPLSVNLSVSIEGFHKLDDINMEFTTDIHVHAVWPDSRLRFENGPNEVRIVPTFAPKLVWLPDLSFLNARDSSLRENLNPELSVVVTADGIVTASTRISLVTYCDLNLRDYPMDQHECIIRIGNYLYTRDEVYFNWSTTDPVTVTTTSNPRNFQVQKVTNGQRIVDSTKELSITVVLSRHSVHHVVFVYLPSLLIVCLSCLVFWLPLSDLLERLLFVCTLLVSLLAIVLLTAINSPTVGYMKAIDLWVIVCFLFIFIALLESILIYLLSNKRPEPPGNANEFELMKEDESRSDLSARIRDMTLAERYPLLHRIDLITRVVYPSLFVVFTAIYWAVVAA